MISAVRYRFRIYLSPISNLTLIDLFDHISIHLKVPVNIHQTVDLLLHVCHLCITVTAHVRNLLNSRSDLIKSPDEIFFRIH